MRKFIYTLPKNNNLPQETEISLLFSKLKSGNYKIGDINNIGSENEIYLLPDPAIPDDIYIFTRKKAEQLLEQNSNDISNFIRLAKTNKNHDAQKVYFFHLY